MSAGTATHHQPAKTPRQLSAINGAVSANVAAALSNHDSETNGAPIPPGGGLGSGPTQVTWTSGTIVPKSSGTYLIMGVMYVKANAVDAPISFSLVRDAGNVLHPESLIGPSQVQDGGHVGGDASVSITWIDVGGAGVSHTYGIRATNQNGGGNTVQVPGAAQTAIVVVELPG